MSETGLYSVDVWVGFDTVDKTGHFLADLADFHDESLLAPGKVVVAFDDDHVALACVVGRPGGGVRPSFASTWRPAASTNTFKRWCGRSVIPAMTDGMRRPTA